MQVFRIQIKTFTNFLMNIISANGFVVSFRCLFLAFNPVFYAWWYCHVLYVQVTPKAIRLRKKYLDVNKRKTMSKRPKEWNLFLVKFCSLHRYAKCIKILTYNCNTSLYLHLVICHKMQKKYIFLTYLLGNNNVNEK